MIIDFESPLAPREGNFDVAILGAGVAGITLAMKLAVGGRRVLLLEGGAFDYEQRSQDLYGGALAGRPYTLFESSRLRYLGGSSNHWQGWSYPMDEELFSPRPWIGGAAWPIGKADLDPYLAESCELLDLNPTFDRFALREDDATLLGQHANISGGPDFLNVARFGSRYRFLLQDHPNILLLINANALELVRSDDASHAESVRVAGYGDERAQYSAKAFVIALGGMENARFLLNQYEGWGKAGPAADLVGRNFMDHLSTIVGYFAIRKDAALLNDSQLFMLPSASFNQEEEIAQAALLLWRGEKLLPLEAHGVAPNQQEVLAELKQSLPGLASEDMEIGVLAAICEQVPNAQSRVGLTNDRDRFGQRRTLVDWHLSPMDIKTLRRTTLLLAERLAQWDVGRIKLAPWVRDAALPFPEEFPVELAQAHHMGTTRMAADPSDGVVDGNCRLFDLSNVFVSGSSVFAYGGRSNPTLVITQLALRLADHLNKVAL